VEKEVWTREIAAQVNSEIEQRSHLEIKGTPTRHHDQPFEYPGRALKVGKREKRRLIELWASPDASVCDKRRVLA